MKQTKQIFNFGGKSLEVEYRPFVRTSYKDKHPATSRAYVFMDGKTEFTQDDIYKIAQNLGLDYIHTHIGDYPEIDKAWNKLNREVVKNQREVLNKSLEILGFDVLSLEISFSKKAGCNCGCSPGFVIKGLPDITDIYISSMKEDE